MNNKAVIYELDPSSVKFDTIVSSFNRLQTKSELEATSESIQQNGQMQPILMDNGLCIDGRHRVKVCKELGINVKAIDIDSTLTVADKLAMSNLDLTSGRKVNKAQQAIQALKYLEVTGEDKQDVAVKFNLNKRLLSYAATVKKFTPIAYKSLEDHGFAVIDGKKTSSLETISRWANREKEKAVKIIDSAPSDLDYNVLINTEAGKELFWLLYNEARRPDAELAMHLVTYVNLKFVVVGDKVNI